MNVRQMCWACYLLLGLCLRGWSQEPVPHTVRLVDGSRFNATLAGIDDSGVTLVSGGKDRTLALDDLLDWGHPAEIRKGSYLLLSDGGVVVGEVTSVTAEHVVIGSARR